MASLAVFGVYSSHTSTLEDVMANWWAEQWSFGSGSSRVSCGVSRTDEGYVVDVVRGDTSVESFVYPSREEAMDVAQGLKLYYRDTASAGRRGHA